MESDFLKNIAFRLLLAGLTILLGLALLTTNSCTHEGPALDQLEEICFTEQVLPIFQNSCATTDCHDVTTAEKGYVFTDYAGIMKAITPGNSDESKAYQAITSASELMPPDNPLPLDKRTLIRLWIEQGAEETTCGTDASANLNK